MKIVQTNNRHLILLCACLTIIVLNLDSCDRRTTLINYQSVISSQWERADVKQFVFTEIAESGDYDIDLLLRTDNKFPFTSLAVVVDEIILPAAVRKTDSLTCTIFDEKGNAIGKGMTLFQHSFPINTQRLDVGDTVNVTIKHNMQRIILPGITDVGVSLTKR